MTRGRTQAIVAGALSLAAGIGLAAVVAGAAAGPSHRDATIFDEDKILKFGSGDGAEIITISGRQTRCCITIDANTTITDFSEKCERPGGGSSQVVCNARRFRRVEVTTGYGSDDVKVSGRFDALKIHGENDNDKIVGGKGGENLLGGEDNDLLKGRGGKDRVNGGPGGDVCRASRESKIKNCET